MTFRRGLFGVLVCVLGLGACDGDGAGKGPGDPSPTGSIHAALVAGQLPGVAAVRIDVLLGNVTVKSSTLPLPAAATGGPMLAPDASAPDVDAYFVLPPGTYTVVAQALDANGSVSTICMRTSVAAMVAASLTTEVDLRLLCGAANGGLDTSVTIVTPPLITGLTFDPSKFSLACESVTVAVMATDPAGNGGPLSYSWTLVAGPSDPSTSLISNGASATFFTTAPGDYTLRVNVTDQNGTASLSFPLHILPSVNTNCSASTEGGGANGLATRPPRTLPLPPRQQGCFRGTANGWVAIPCAPPGTLGPILTTETAIETPNGASPTIPFQFGQVETTLTAFGSETDSRFSANAFSVQGNTAFFTGSNGDSDWVQFVAQANGGTTTLKIETWDITTFTNAGSTCPGGSCAASCGCADFGVTNIASRGTYNQFDFADIAGSVYNDTNGNPSLGMVAQFSWFDPANDPSNNRGLYAVVTSDQYGLATRWNQFSGGILGLGASSNANFTNSSVLTRTLAGSCVNGSSPVTNIPWPGTCTGSPQLLPDTTIGEVSPTAEGNNMCKVGSSTPLVSANQNLVYTSNLYSTSCGPASCISNSSRIFVRSTDEDNGVRPINFGTQAFWESPDLFLVPAGTPVDVNAVSTETLVTPGSNFDVYVRVNNDFGCSPVTGAKALVYLADPAALSTSWVSITGGQYLDRNGDSAGLSVPAGGRALLGPFTFTAPSTGLGDGHKCMLAAVTADGEPGPADTTNPVASYQVGQRNLQFSNCVLPLTNATVSDGLVTLTLTAVGAVPSLTGANDLAVTFDDPAQAWYAIWLPGAGSGYALSQAAGQTTVRLGQVSVTLAPVPLAAGQSVNATAVVSLGTNQPTTTFQIGATLADSMGKVLVGNGLSCVGTGPIIR